MNGLMTLFRIEITFTCKPNIIKNISLEIELRDVTSIFY